jgi:hypothetical protein
MAELFGPYSPVWRSPTTSIVPSLVEACMRADALVHEDTCAITADSITGENTIEHAIVVPSETTVQIIERTLQQIVTPIKDIVLVEDASDNEDIVSQVTVEDPIFLITIEDSPTYSATEVKTDSPS